jgi:hypothetical protein
VKADFEELLGRYFAREPAVDALSEIRRRQAGRNLRLVFDSLIVLAATHQSTSAAAEVLTSLGEAARSNQSIARAGAVGGDPLATGDEVANEQQASIPPPSSRTRPPPPG